MNQQENEIEIDLREIFFLVKKKLMIIIVFAFIAGAATGAYNKFLVKPMYSSTSKIFILTKSTTITTFADIQIGNSLTGDYMELIKSRPVVEKVIENQNLDETYESMRQKLTISNPTDTRILTITIEYNEPNTAKAIADEFAEVAKDSISDIMDMQKPNIVEYGHVNTNKISPSTMRNSMIAAILAGFLTVAIIIFMYIMNDTIQSTEDIEKHLDLNVLSVIPLAEDERSLGRKSKKRKNGLFKIRKKVRK